MILEVKCDCSFMASPALSILCSSSSALDFSSSAVSCAFSDEDEADVVACDEDDISVDVVSEGGCFDSASSVSMISSADFSSLVDGCCLSDVGDCCCAAEEDESEAGDFSIAEELDDAPSIPEDAGGGDDEGPDFTFASPESHGPERMALVNQRIII